jgi:hypothetical protein
MRGLTLLHSLLEEVPERLGRMPLGKVDAKTAELTWSPKQELGHLLDSAANNHQRIVRAQIEQEPAMPGYNADEWVELHKYQDRDWQEMIGIWRALNMQLLVAAEAVPDTAWERTCTIGDSMPLTLKFVFEDYLEHMMHHLQHMGIELEDLKA